MPVSRLIPAAAIRAHSRAIQPHPGAMRLCLQAFRQIVAERRSLRPAVRFVARAVAHPGPTLRLLYYFARQPAGVLPRSVFVDSVLKIGREHVRRGLGASGRTDMLIAHHAALRRAMSEAALSRYLRHEAICLARLEGREPGEAFEVRMFQTPFGYRREGEATLSLVASASGARLADLTFAVASGPDGELCLRIGGIQGPPPPHGKDAVKAATKALDGLRPKTVVMEVVCELGRLFGVGAVFATALSHHVLLDKKGRMMHAAPYDGFWEELGGIRLLDGDFALPLTPPHRDPAEVPAKRRREWERRQQRIATLAGDVRAAMQALRDQT